MGLFGVAPAAMRPAALGMHIVVASACTLRFASAGLVPWRILLPLCLASVPAAFLGGSVALPAGVYQRLLGLILLFAAWRLWSPFGRDAAAAPPAAPALLGVGAGFGLLAGLTGIGGRGFLSPLPILARGEVPRRSAGASVAVI